MSTSDNTMLTFTRRNKKQQEKQNADIQQDLGTEKVCLLFVTISLSNSLFCVLKKINSRFKC